MLSTQVKEKWKKAGSEGKKKKKRESFGCYALCFEWNFL